MQFTHRLDTSYTHESVERVKTLQSLWRTLMKYFVEKGNKVKVKYWPGDLVIPHSLSSFGIKSIEKHAISKQSLVNLDMEEIICPLNNETTQIIFQEATDNYGKDSVSNWFNIKILDKEDNSILCSQDFGDTLLVSLLNEDIIRLNEMGFSTDYLITLPEPVPK